MEQLTATLVKDTGNQRFYKLSHKLTKAANVLSGKTDLIEALKNTLSDVKDEYKHLYPQDGVDLICVSDANTYDERLVFAAMGMGGDDYGRTRVQVDGCWTMSIHGGDASSMKPDHVYLRRLASANGLAFHQCEAAPQL